MPAARPGVRRKKLATEPFSHGEPGSMNNVFTPTRPSHSRKHLAVNSHESHCGLPKRQSRFPHQRGAASVGRSPSQGPSAASPGRSAAHRTSSSKGVRLLRHTDLLDRFQDGLASPHLDLDLSKLGNNLLSQFLLSAWHWLPPLVCSTPRFALWKRCRLRGAGHSPAVTSRVQGPRAKPHRPPFTRQTFAEVLLVVLSFSLAAANRRPLSTAPRNRSYPRR